MKHTRILLLTLAAVLLLGTGSALALGYRHSATSMAMPTIRHK